MNKRERIPVKDPEAVQAILHRIPLFGGLNEEEVAEVIRVLWMERYTPGEYIFRQGDPPDHIRIIRSGRVRIEEEIDGKTVELVVFDVGDSFGETAVIAIHPHSASAVAIDDCEILVFPRQEMFAFYHSRPRLFGMLMLNIAREVCRRLKRTENTMLHYALARTEAERRKLQEEQPQNDSPGAR